MNKTTEFNKGILPLIRQIIPNVVARELVSVQPMSAPSFMDFANNYSLSLETGVSHDPENEMPEWYWVKCHHVLSDELNAMIKWCDSSFGKIGGELWQLDISQRTFLFTYERDQMLFLLKWSK